MIANAQSQSKSELEKITEQLKDLQVELYETNNTISNIESLADEFEELSNKIGKSNDELERMKEIIQQVNDIAGYPVVDISASPEEQAAQMRGHASVQKQEVQRTISDMKSTIGYNAAITVADPNFQESLDQEQLDKIINSKENET